MNPRTEERLRAAFAAKADQVTEARLTARRRLPAEGLEDGSDDPAAAAGSTAATGRDAAGGRELRADPAWRAHWLAPALAAAAVAAVAARAQRPPNSDGPRQAHAPSGQSEQQPDSEPDPA